VYLIWSDGNDGICLAAIIEMRVRGYLQTLRRSNQ